MPLSAWLNYAILAVNLPRTKTENGLSTADWYDHNLDKTLRSDEVPVWLSVWSEVQTICIWFGWCHCHPVISCFGKIQNGLSFWYRPTQVVLGKKAVKRLCVCVLDKTQLTSCKKLRAKLDTPIQNTHWLTNCLYDNQQCKTYASKSLKHQFLWLKLLLTTKVDNGKESFCIICSKISHAFSKITSRNKLRQLVY